MNIKEVGDAVELAEKYQNQGADELVFLDITATNEKRKTIIDTVTSVAEKVFMPLTVGGIRNIDDMKKILRAGADKISLNSAAVKNPEIIRQGAEIFGKQCIVTAIDAKRNGKGGFNVVVNGGRIDTGLGAVEWAKKAVSLGSGEILLTSMDADGTKNGFDIELLNLICDAVDVPVIASGGCGKLSHFADVFKNTKADAALAASLFHFDELCVNDVKEYLHKQNIPVRIQSGGKV